MENSSEIEIRLPIKIQYSALQDIINEKLVGEFIEKSNKEKKSTKYAQIVDAKLVHGTHKDYDLDLFIGLKILTSLFKNKLISLVVHLSFNFNKEAQRIEIVNYKIETKTHSWLLDKFLEATLNSLLFHKLKQKMRLDLQPVIQKRLGEINKRLSQSIEPKKGIFLTGEINKIRMLDLKYTPQYLLVFIETKAEGEVYLKEINL